MHKLLFSLILLTILFARCNKPEESNKDIVARIGDELLTKNDLNTLLLNNNIALEDSIFLIQKYVRNWIINQILSQKAEKKLNTTDLNKIEKMVDEYKTTLFVQQYKQRYINQKLDTSVSEQELIHFYQTFNFDYHLKNTVVKALMITFPTTTNLFYKVKKLLKGKLDKNLSEIEKLSKENKLIINNFNKVWIDFDFFKTTFNITENQLNNNNNIFSKKDTIKNTVSLLKIIEFKLPGDTIPFPMVKENLKKIIIHKRKQDIIYKLEHNAYEDAVDNKNYFVAKPYILQNEN